MSDAQIFQVFSLAYLSIGIGILINRGFYKKVFEEFVDDGLAMYFGGAMALVVGYLIVAFHNEWTKDWSVIITVVGWLALVKGIIILILPKLMTGLTRAMVKNNVLLTIMGVFALVVGVAFSFLGFCPKSPI
jgi:hypothetical protein